MYKDALNVNDTVAGFWDGPRTLSWVVTYKVGTYVEQQGFLAFGTIVPYLLEKQLMTKIAVPILRKI